MSPTVFFRSTVTVRSAVITNVVLLALLAAFALLAPSVVLDGFGITQAPFAVLGLVRVLAVLAIVLAAIVWTARSWLESPDGRATVVALTIAYAFGAVFLFTQQWTVWFGRSGVGLTLGCAELAISYGRALWKSRSAPFAAPSQPAHG